jgi:predicted CopG family antitoxin
VPAGACSEHVGDIVKELRERKELDREIVTLTVGKREGEWFTLGGAKTLLGMVPYRMTRRERAELLDELATRRLEKPRVGAGVGAEAGAGAKPAAPELVKLKDGQESVIKMGQEEGKDEDGDGWLDVRVVWLGGKEYVSTRDVIKHTIEKTGKLAVKARVRVKAGVEAGAI